ncbi:SAM-dependent methyltransferase [Amycolatopsis sp. OK19-0408]|uniref:SAM-dependent methyltransferase n=1 Tax=Amycolatopsis iheyensis TaxID=2945988 RepID=A0A9X2NL61_9PSEU|nr:SAM-dependent methyltransferase [Amycolatopsis iheyensis]MCR6488327.1 SAM-dependent methyltransferase [Amycolatopsis iheyensis]
MPVPSHPAGSTSDPTTPPFPGLDISSAAQPSLSDTALKVAARQWTPPPLDLENVHPARVRDHFLGGDQAFALDREWCAQATHLVPTLPRTYRDERDFLHRAIRFASRQGHIHRFLVLGAGLPYTRPIHDDVLPHPRGMVVYADHDEYVTAHVRLVEPELPQIAAVRGDFLEPGTIFFDDAVRTLLRHGSPIGLVLTGVLETVADTDQATTALRCYTERLPAGSVVIATHATVEGLDAGDTADATLAEHRRILCDTYGRTAHRPPQHLRTTEELRQILGCLRLIPPGITHTSAWHNPRLAHGDRPVESLCLAAVAHLRRPRTPPSSAGHLRSVDGGTR